MPIVLVKDALDTDCVRARAAEVLDELLWVTPAVYLAHVVQLVVEQTKFVSRGCRGHLLLLQFAVSGDQPDQLLVLVKLLEVGRGDSRLAIRAIPLL